MKKLLFLPINISLEFDTFEFESSIVYKQSFWISNAIKNQSSNFSIAVSILTYKGWRGGQVTQAGDPVKIYSFIDSTIKEQNYYTQFVYYVMKSS